MQSYRKSILRRVLMSVFLVAAPQIVFAQNGEWVPATGKITTTANVGIGTTTPLGKFHVQGNGSTVINGGSVQMYGNNSITFGNGQNIKDNNGGNLLIDGGVDLTMITSTGAVIISPGSQQTNIWGNLMASNFMAVGQTPCNGNVCDQTLRFVVHGSASIEGNIAAKFQDVAEWVPASQPMSPGMVVVLDPAKSNHVMPSSRAYDTTVAGVVSAQPGVILGEGSPSKEQIATTGRVKVRVDASRSAIHIGDLLVTSDRSGTAMRSESVDVGGIKIHRPGTLIGKALEPLESGEGEILVLLSLQ